MKFERHLKEEVGINLTPLIDVVFLLLIFFMVTTTFTRDGNLLINLPEASAEAATELPSQLEILVESNGAYAVNGRALNARSPEALKTALDSVANGDRNLPVTITADADTTHQSVVTAMDVVAQLGFSRLNIATRQNTANESTAD